MIVVIVVLVVLVAVVVVIVVVFVVVAVAVAAAFAFAVPVVVIVVVVVVIVAVVAIVVTVVVSVAANDQRLLPLLKCDPVRGKCQLRGSRLLAERLGSDTGVANWPLHCGLFLLDRWPKARSRPLLGGDF